MKQKIYCRVMDGNRCVRELTYDEHLREKELAEVRDKEYWDSLSAERRSIIKWMREMTWP